MIWLLALVVVAYLASGVRLAVLFHRSVKWDYEHDEIDYEPHIFPDDVVVTLLWLPCWIVAQRRARAARSGNPQPASEPVPTPPLASTTPKESHDG